MGICDELFVALPMTTFSVRGAGASTGFGAGAGLAGVDGLADGGDTLGTPPLFNALTIASRSAVEESTSDGGDTLGRD